MRQYDAYFQHWNKEQKTLGGVSNPDRRILDVAAAMKAEPRVNKVDLENAAMRAGDCTAQQARSVVECTVRVVLMVDCKSGLRRGERRRRGRRRHWRDGEPLSDFISGVFYPSGPPPPADPPLMEEQQQQQQNVPSRVADRLIEATNVNSRLTHWLTGHNLDRFSGLTIRWTSYLSDHLLLTETSIHLFQHKRWLLDTIALQQNAG